MSYNGLQKLFLINSWRYHNGLPEWPVPGCTDYPKTCDKTLDEIIKHNKAHTQSTWLRSLPVLSYIFEDEELNKQRDLGYLMGYFRYENPYSLDYKPNKGAVNKEYCAKRIQEKLNMFKDDPNVTYVVDVINLIELWFVGSNYDDEYYISLYDMPYSSTLRINILHYISLLKDMYECWELYTHDCTHWYLKWTDDGRPEKGLGA